jgi:hypothetical protein
MFTSHPSAALEYWFFKVNAGPIALIVDWIERRKINERWLRVSMHSPHKREVIFEKLDALMPGDNFLNTQRTVGHAGDVSWELDIDPAHTWIKPDIFPAGLLHMSDLTVISAPLATFTGWICHGPQQTSLNHVPGLVSHYWGRQLASEWWWVSAHQFDREGIAVECSVLRSSLWGTSAQIPLAYLYLHQQGRSEFLIPLSPARVVGSPENFQIEFNRLGREKITLIGTGRQYGDFGDRIINTLTGDLEIREGSRVIARANGTAGLERRTPATLLPIAVKG